MKLNLPNLSSIKKVHIIGVCGTLMGSFAAYLKRRGIEVTGSDQNVYPPMSEVLQAAGITVFSGYSPENLQALGGKPDLVVIGNVIRADNPEAQAAIQGGFVYSSLPEAMECLFLINTRNIVAAGTHGKTTTSSLLAYVLASCGSDPSYFIGGVPHDLPFSFHISKLDKGHSFVLEGDEYDTAFWDKVPKFNHYLPNDVILTSIEFDHADIYKDLDAVIQAFEGLVSRIRPNGRLISCFDYPVIKKLVAQAKVPVLSYGSSADVGAQFFPREVRSDNGVIHFNIYDSTRMENQRGKPVDRIQLHIPGHHNVLNALAVWIEAKELGLPMEQVRNALRSFNGVKRRQEVRGEVRGVVVIDDFAHHPTAVRETLKALRLKYPEKRLLTVFEPRSATSRRKIFQKEYSQAFQEADLIFIANPYDQTRISLEDQFSSETLVEDLKEHQKDAHLMESVENGVLELSRMSKPGDLVAVLSNGGFDGFISKLLKNLAHRHA